MYRKFVFYLFLLCLWNTLEVRKFTEFMFNSISIEKTSLWSAPENYKFIPGYGGSNTQWPEGNYDPKLEIRLLDESLKPIPHFDNKVAVMNKCLSNHYDIKENTKFPIEDSPTHLKNIQLLQFTINPEKHYAVCFKMISQYCPGIFHIKGIKHSSTFYNLLGSYSGLQKNITKQIILMSTYTTDKKPKKIDVEFTADPDSNNKAYIKFERYGKTLYNNRDLPIKIESLVPFTANVTTSRDHTYLQTYRFYLPGYKALVNGQVVDVKKSPEDSVMIPLQKGKNHIVLKFIGTSAVQFSFYISIISWLAIMITFSAYVLRKYLTWTKYDIKNTSNSLS